MSASFYQWGRLRMFDANIGKWFRTTGFMLGPVVGSLAAASLGLFPGAPLIGP
jgi:hypothetical protein